MRVTELMGDLTSQHDDLTKRAKLDVMLDGCPGMITFRHFPQRNFIAVNALAEVGALYANIVSMARS